jgi:DNA-binding HxlR family transcriptional regulator
MNNLNENPYDDLKKIFHEPKRMAIMSALCAADGGMSFMELKKECDISDGNLNRHLKTLIDAEAVIMKKEFIGLKPRTTVFLAEKGLEDFTAYLNALSEVLDQALQSMPKRNSAADADGLTTTGNQPGVITPRRA